MEVVSVLIDIWKWEHADVLCIGLFMQGCDASILINSKSGNTAEKDAGSNLTVHGYDLIDTAKAAVEKICPGKVSCADIIALATRDAIKLVQN